MLSRTFSIDLDLAERKAAKDSKRFPASISSDAPITRPGWNGWTEVLSHARDAIDLSRAPLPLIESHDRTKVNIGIVDDLSISGGRLRGEVVFGSSARAQELAADVSAGIVRNLSVGYEVLEQKDDESSRRMTITKWRPHEVSIVSTPADTTVGFGRSHMPDRSEGPPTTTTPQPPADDASRTAIEFATRAERDRARHIRQIVRIAHLGDDVAEDLIDRGTSVDVASRAVLEALARREEQTAIDGHIRSMDGDFQALRGRGSIIGGADYNDPAFKIRALGEALACRATGAKPSDEARPYMTFGFVDAAKAVLEMRGVATRFLSRQQLVTRAAYQTTGDYAALFSDTGNRVLNAAYEAAPAGVRRVARKGTVPDFRAKSLISFSEAPALEKVNEHGEFKSGAMATAKESYSAITAGKLIGFSRQAIVNDDLSALNDLLAKMGQAAAEYVAQSLVDLLTSNSLAGPTMASDSIALFNTATHKNLAASGGAISVTTLATAMAALRTMKGLTGVPINIEGRLLLVPAAIEAVARQFVATINAAQSSNVNPFAGLIEVVIDPRLDAKSATGWYLCADPAVAAALEYSFLDGSPGPSLESRMGWEVDGAEFKVRIDVGSGAVDWRPIYRNPGA